MKPHPGIWRDAEYYEVAVYWPHAGEADPYGGRHQVGTLADAEKLAEDSRRQGYKLVHVRKVTIQVLRADH